MQATVPCYKLLYRLLLLVHKIILLITLCLHESGCSLIIHNNYCSLLQQEIKFNTTNDYCYWLLGCCYWYNNNDYYYWTNASTNYCCYGTAHNDITACLSTDAIINFIVVINLHVVKTRINMILKVQVHIVVSSKTGASTRLH